MTGGCRRFELNSQDPVQSFRLEEGNLSLEDAMATPVAVDGLDEPVTALYDHSIVSKPGGIPKDRAKWLE